MPPVGISPTLVAGYNGNDGLTQAHLLPYGLRTVDGSYNNLLPGREMWGAADQSFPGIFDAELSERRRWRQP